MAHNEEILINLNLMKLKKDLVRMKLDYQEKLNGILDDLNKDISYLKVIYLG